MNEVMHGNRDDVGASSPRDHHVLRTNFFLDKVGEVVVTLRSDGLICEHLDDNRKVLSSRFGCKILRGGACDVKFCDSYSVEYIGHWLSDRSNIIVVKNLLLQRQMFWLKLIYARKSARNPGVLIPSSFALGHADSQICQSWTEQIKALLELQSGRPKNLMIFINPRSGRTNGYNTWQTVLPIFDQAKIKTKMIVTERAGHAYDVMASCGTDELESYDGFITVGGDGFFNEILNGFLLSRHKAHYPPQPSDTYHEHQSDNEAISHQEGIEPEISSENEKHPLLRRTQHDSESNFPFEKFRFGIIPAGSTDAVAMCTTGTRDPVTCALLIVLGKKIRLDIAQIVRWKATFASPTQPCVRYAASFAGYGFYGDVITESEKYRWMGPKRYDCAGTKVFMQHRLYAAEIAYLETEKKDERKDVCRANCDVCRTNTAAPDEKLNWRRCRGNFVSVGAALMSNRNDRAPDGLVADAHLSDGFLHLVLVRECSRPQYLRHLTQLSKRGGRPLDFDFVERYKTSAFTFSSAGDQSVWNIDGELFPAHQLSVQVFRGLIHFFASGPHR